MMVIRYGHSAHIVSPKMSAKRTDITLYGYGCPCGVLKLDSSTLARSEHMGYVIVSMSKASSTFFVRYVFTLAKGNNCCYLLNLQS
jgi:hypothetical protein